MEAGQYDSAAVLMNRGLNGGFGFNNGLPGGEFGTLSSNAVRTEESARASATGFDNVLDQGNFSSLNHTVVNGNNRIIDNVNLSDNRTNDNIIRGDSRIIDRANENNERVIDRSTASEFRTADRLRDIEREAAANARDAAKCCCDAQLLAIQNQCKTDAGLAQILAGQASAVAVSDAVANAVQNSKLDRLLDERSRPRT